MLEPRSVLVFFVSVLAGFIIYSVCRCFLSNVVHRLRTSLRNRLDTAAAPLSCTHQLNERDAGRPEEQTSGSLILDVRQLYESPRVPGRPRRSPQQSLCQTEHLTPSCSPSDGDTLITNCADQTRAPCLQAALADQLSSQTSDCGYSTGNQSGNEAQNNGENSSILGGSSSSHSSDDGTSNELTVRPREQAIDHEFPHLSSLNTLYGGTANPNTTGAPLNLFDCNSLVPSSRRCQYPLVLENDFMRACPSTSSTAMQHPPHAAHLTSSAPHLPPALTFERAEDSGGRSHRSQTMELDTIECTLRPINNHQPYPSFHRSILFGQLPPPSQSIDRPQTSEESALQGGLSSVLQGGCSSAVYESNASLVSSLLWQDQLVPWFDEQSPPPYSDLPPPSYFEATLNDLLNKQKTIIGRKKQISFSDL